MLISNLQKIYVNGLYLEQSTQESGTMFRNGTFSSPHPCSYLYSSC